MKYFKKEYEPSIIKHTNKRIVQEWCDKHNVPIKIDNLSTFWYGFCVMYGQLNGLTYIESNSFGYMVSMFITGDCVNLGTDVYFREGDIEWNLIGIYDELKKDNSDEEELVKEFFYYTIKLYLTDIEKYTYKIHHLTFRLSQSDYDKFMDVDGKDKVSKLRTLIKYYYG